MEIFLTSIIIIFSGLLIYLLVKISDYKDQITFTEARFKLKEEINRNLIAHIDSLNLEIGGLNEGIKKIQNRNLKVGATFFYPNGFNFKPELVNKRAKIISIEDSCIKSRLIDEKGNFIDDVEWEGTPSNSVNYIYENNNFLYFEFK